MVVSSDSPDLWETMTLYPWSADISRAFCASVTVPIWLTLSRSAFAAPSEIPLLSLRVCW
jgi:hypothetical protein